MTTPHTEMHFGPSWMQNSSRAKSFQKQAASASSDDAAAAAAANGGPHPSAALSYSSVIREQAALANGAHPAADAQPGFADAAHPFRYSKEAMLALWHDNKARELPIEFERWEVIFRPDGGMPAGLKDMDEVEKRAFGLSFNPDRRPTASTANSSASLATLGDLKLDPPARRRQVAGAGAEALNSPVRERFGGIQGGVLGGLGMGAKEPFAGAAGAVKGAPRRKEEISAPLPPSSTNSWRPTRALSSNLPTAEPTTPGHETVTADGRRWRTGTEEPVAAAPGPDRAAASAGFNANAARAGGWRERERMKKAEGELSSNAGWTSVDKADPKKGRSGAATADDKAGDTFSNAYAALDQDDEADVPAQAEATPAAPQQSQEQLEKDALKLVNWTYKDPAGNVQGPFPAQNMHDWNAQGYFAPSLLVKRESDAAYETVATLTLLSPDPNEIFFQRPAVKAPAPPGLMPTAAQMLGLGAVSTPLVSPLVGFADPALAERNPVDQFMQQGENPAARWGGLGTPTRQHAQPFANGIAQQSPYQQHSQPVFDPAGQLYGQRTPARHPFQDPTPFGMAPNQSPYASPLPQHHAVAPWNQPQAPQPAQPFFGMGGPQYGAPAPANNGGFGYPGMTNVGLSGGEPWAGGASNDWRNPMSPGGQNLVPQQQQQQQMSYAQDLMAQQGLQHQQQQQQQQQQMWPPANVAPQQSLAPGPVAQAANSQHSEQPAQAAEPTPEVQEAEAPKAPVNANAWGKVPTQAVENLSLQQEQAPAVEATSTANESVAASEPVAAATPAKAAPVEKAAAVVASPAPVKLTKAEARKAAAAAAAAAAVVEPVERAAQPSPAPKAAAPWAKLEEEAALPSPSLREIQQAEAVKAAAAAPKKAAPQQQSTETAKSGSPTSSTTVSWGLNGSNAAKPAVAAPAPATSPAPAAVWQTSSATPSKTLKQIQEEEARQKARAAQLKAAQSASLGSAAAKAAYAGALSTAAAQSNAAAAASAWSTVGSGGKAVAGAARPAAPAAQAAATRPAAAVAAPKPSVITSIQSSSSMTRSSSAASSIDEATPSAEFLAWAKVALKSVTGVNLDEFLQMLLTFPLNPDPIVMEIISDSVYANSSTLDGRRFAQEFVSKRKADAKAQKAGTVAPAGKGSSLADIVKAQPKPAADAGFGAFKVVKKKGKKA